MSDDSPDKGRGLVIRIGMYGDCLFDVVAGDLASVEADVAIAALCAHRPTHLGGGIDALDHALHGAIVRLRADDIFSGAWSETLYLSSLPSTVRARGVIMLGLGLPGRNTTGKIRRALKVAASQAARIGASHAVFAPAQLNTGSPRANAVATARAVLMGIADAFSRPRCRLQRWSFVAPACEVEQVARHFAMAFDRIVEHEGGSDISMEPIRKRLWQTCN